MPQPEVGPIGAHGGTTVEAALRGHRRAGGRRALPQHRLALGERVGLLAVSPGPSASQGCRCGLREETGPPSGRTVFRFGCGCGPCDRAWEARRVHMGGDNPRTPRTGGRRRTAPCLNFVKKEADVLFSDMSVDRECMWFEPKWGLSRNDGGSGMILPI